MGKPNLDGFESLEYIGFNIRPLPETGWKEYPVLSG